MKRAGGAAGWAASSVRLIPVIALAGVCAAILFFVNQGTTKPVSPQSQVARSASFDFLIGDWIRDDGDYMIRVRSVGPDGKVDAAYLNPGPIHVAQALASNGDGTVSLSVVLQDVGYPGSKYSLKYRGEDDTLLGTYFQAVEQQTYPVVFHRVPRS